jgi:hypothetical protein
MSRYILSMLAVAAVVIGLSGVAQAGLIANWAFDEGVGAATATDAMGSYNGTVDTSAYKPTTGESGKIGKSYSFAWNASSTLGSGGVTVPSSTDLLVNYTSFTFSSWFYVTGAAHDQFLLTRSDAYNFPQTNWSVLGGSDGRPCLQVRTSSTTSSALVATGNAGALPNNLNAWHLITGTFDGSTGTTTLYVDAVSRATSGAVSGVTTTGSNPYAVGIGIDPSRADKIFTGKLDDMAIWKNQILSITQMKAIYTAPTAFATDAGLGFYGAKDMDNLFGVYGGDHNSTTSINGKTWGYLATMPTGHAAGDSWIDGGNYYVQLGSADGMATTIPEPGTLALLAAGLVGLLCYAWRKRK